MKYLQRRKKMGISVIDLHAAFISLVVGIGGGVYLRAVFNRINTVYLLVF